MATEYVSLLSEVMKDLGCLSCDGFIENVSASSLSEAFKAMKESHVDIVHFHGCWRDSDFMVARKAAKDGTRMVVSPHGQLEPWIIRQNYWKSRLPRILAYQKRIVNEAFAVVVMGKMEENCMMQLGWNNRVEVIHNSMITDLITEGEMASKMLSVYNKIMDSHTFALLDAEERLAFASLIKAGVTRDSRWLTDNEKASVSRLSATGWRRIILHAYHTSINNTISDAIDTLGMPYPDVKPEEIPCYLPKAERRKGLFSKDIPPLPPVIADDKGDHTGSFTSFVKILHQHAGAGQLSIRDIVETAFQMRRICIDEQAFNEDMKMRSLDKFVASLMHIMTEYTGMESGFLLSVPQNDRRTRRLAAMLDDELSISASHTVGDNQKN